MTHCGGFEGSFPTVTRTVSVTGWPAGSSTLIWSAGVMARPLGVLVGCCVNTNVPNCVPVALNVILPVPSAAGKIHFAPRVHVTLSLIHAGIVIAADEARGNPLRPARIHK